MMKRIVIVVSLSIILLVNLVFKGCRIDDNTSPGPPQFENLEQEIDYLVGQYLKVGMVVGIIDSKQRKRVFAYGSKTTGYEDAPDENTVFEIGSITKSFTCLIAARFMEKELLNSDTAQHYLPADQVTLPSFKGKPITLRSLLTHTSGIPRKPVDDGYELPPGYDGNNPYAAYTTSYMYNYLTDHCRLSFEPGTSWEYSNAGMGLMGHILGLVDSTSYETVLKREVFDMLGMDNSSLFLTEAQKVNYATGYNRSLQPLPEFTAKDIMQGVGFIKSSVDDMFKYMEAQMGLNDNPLSQAMVYCQQPQLELEYWGHQCLGWYKKTLDDGQQITYCGGNTIGFGSYLGFNKSMSTGVILLYNADFGDGANLILGPAILEAINRY